MKGFRFEDTEVTQAERILTLLMTVSTAFSWACRTGVLLVAKTPLTLKRHGRHTASVFQVGIDHLQDLLLQPLQASPRALSSLMPSFLIVRSSAPDRALSGQSAA